MTRPTVLHEKISLRLFRQLDRLPRWARGPARAGHPAGRDGRVPDIAVVRTGRVIRRGQVGTDVTDAVLLVEVVSPSSRKNDRFLMPIENDRFLMPIEYATAGVPQHWRVEVEPRLFVVTFVLAEGAVRRDRSVDRRPRAGHPVRLVLDVSALLPPQLVED